MKFNAKLASLVVCLGLTSLLQIESLSVFIVALIGYSFLLKLASLLNSITVKSLLYVSAITILPSLLYFYWVTKEGDWVTTVLRLDVSFQNSVFSISILFLYLFLIVIVSLVFESITNYGKSSLNFSTIKHVPIHVNNYLNISIVKNDLLIIILIIASSLMRFYMFYAGIGIPGIAPPELPFRLTGILYTLNNIMIPAILSYYFVSSKKTLLLYFMYCLFILIYSALSLSKISLVITGFTIIFFAFRHERWLLGLFSSLIALISFILINLGRTNYIIYMENKFQPYLLPSREPFQYSLVTDTFLNNDYNFWSILSSYLGQLLDASLGRLSNFISLLQSSRYDMRNVDGLNPIDVATKVFLHPFQSTINVDQHHMEWQGYTLSAGQYHGGQLFSDSVFFNRFELIPMLVLFSLTTFIFLYIVDYFLAKFKNKFNISYKSQSLLSYAFILLFVVDRGSSILLYSLILLILVTSKQFSFIKIRIKV